ncbi:chorismate mutase [Streptomyces sp. NPDC048111]|uniref:chorismate mutase n=1 Tax=Streptomyces sp. NPDC048111 TaxID=3365500 RepID=UPI003711F67C
MTTPSTTPATPSATPSSTTPAATPAAGPERIGELRLSIDALDRQIIALLARRTAVVRELTTYKNDEETVRSPGRVAQVIDKVRAIAEAEGMPPGIAESVYRTLIGELTDLQMELLAERRAAARTGPAGAPGGAA